MSNPLTAIDLEAVLKATGIAVLPQLVGAVAFLIGAPIAFISAFGWFPFGATLAVGGLATWGVGRFVLAPKAEALGEEYRETISEQAKSIVHQWAKENGGVS